MMTWRIRLLVALLALGSVPSRAETVENEDFLRGKAIYQHGEGNPAEFRKAFDSFMVAAEKGHAHSQFTVGRMYHLGHGVPVDLKQAQHWYLLAGNNGHADAWNNLGIAYAEQGGKEEDIFRCFYRGSEMGSTFANSNVAQYSRLGLYGVRKNHALAIEYYRKTLDQQPDFPEAWNDIGLIYENGGFGVERDLKAAESAYLNGVRVTQDKFSYYNLYRLYWDGHLPARDVSALQYLEEAAEHGHPQAAWMAGSNYVEGWMGVKRDPVKAAYFFELGAGVRHAACMDLLSQRAENKTLIEHYGEERTRAWRTRWVDFQNAAKQEVAKDLAKIRPIFDSGDEAAAETALNEALNRWKGLTVDAFSYHHTIEVWREAQVRSGRSDPEWARFLYSWLAKVFEGDKIPNNIIGARHGLNSLLVELGRYGLLRDSCTTEKRLIRELEGIDVDAVAATVSIGPAFEVLGADKIPLVVDVGESIRSRRIDYELNLKPGELIGGEAMSAMQDFADERLSIGDWKSVLFYAEWIDRWNRKIEATGKHPNRDYPDCLPSMKQACEQLRVDAFSALGLPEKEAAACQTIIDMGLDSYGGRSRHDAQYQLIGIRVDQGQAQREQLEILKTLEDQMRANQYNHSHAWQFAKLVRARVLAVVEGAGAGLALVDEVLAATAAEKRPWLRLEALLVGVDLKLKAGTTEGVVEKLEEALAWARGQGLLLEELRIYQLYVSYLIAVGDYDQALEMQRRVLDLIGALSLTPRHERAVLRLAEIYGLRHESGAALALLADVKDSALADQVKSIVDGLKRSETAAPAVAPARLEPVDLQPMGIQTAPLRNQAEAVFLLTNPNPTDCAVDVTLASEAFGLTVEGKPGEDMAIRCDAGASAGNHRLAVRVEVPGSSHVPVTLFASGLDALEGNGVVGLQAKSAGLPGQQQSEWRIQSGGGDVLVAIVDAARLKNSAFSLIPVYHHLETLDGKEASAALRVVASEPTRIEGYDSDGTLLFVDAQGNGSFRDPGDLLATDRVDDLFPVLKAGSESARIALRYWPESRGANGRVKLRIETRPLGEGGAWKLDGIDWLEP